MASLSFLRPTPPSTLETSARYKWVALAIVTTGMLMATIDSSIVLIAMPAIFRGIGMDPLQPGNSFYLLWMMLGFLIVTSVLVVSLGRLGDMYGRVRIYNAGFALFTLFSAALSVTWMHGRAAGWWLVIMRLFQALGAAMLMSNSSAILTDAFPAHQRGLAMGANQAAAFSGSFIGLIVGGLLAPFDWHLIFLVSVPVGIAGTYFGYRSLRELGERHRARIDWWGNLTFALGLVSLMVGLTYGIQSYGGHPMGWTSPLVRGGIILGVTLLAVFVVMERRIAEPMFRLPLLKIRAFTSGVAASFLAALSRGGLMFLLVIWLQGIWLPEHGYDFARTPLWAGVAMIPLTVGMLISGPLSGYLSDRFGPRPFATGGMIGTAGCFLALQLIPVDFSYPVFGLVLFLTGLCMAAFGSPNRAGVMNALPPRERGVGSGMYTTFQNSAQVFSIGLFFTLLIVGLSASLSTQLDAGLLAHGVSPLDAARASHLPPIATLFAAFLGVNPVAHLLGAHGLASLTAAQRATLTGHSFFPHLIQNSFHTGLRWALDFAIGASLLAALASWVRGERVPLEELSRPGEVLVTD